MAVTWRIEGGGYSYDFPENFELSSGSRDTDIAGRQVDGIDGVVVDNRASKRQNARYVLEGRIQAASVADANTEERLLQGATGQLRAMADFIWLIDIDNGQRAPVYIRSVRTTREMVSTIRVSIVFESTDTPFWEDTAKTFSLAQTSRWIDVPTGNAPSAWVMSLGSSDGAFAHPTLVHGNYALYYDIGLGLASAIALTPATTPWAHFTATFSGSSPANTAHGLGRYTGANTISLANIRIRADKGTFAMQFVARSGNFSDAGNQYIFDLNQSPGVGGTNDRIYLRINGGQNTLEFGNVNGVAQGQMPAYVDGDKYTMSGWWDTDGVVQSVGTVYAELFANGTLIGQAVGSGQNFSPGVTAFADVMVGSSRDHDLFFTETLVKFGVWHQRMGTGFCKQAHQWSQFPKATNRTFKYAATILATHLVEIEHGQADIILLRPTASVATRSFAPFTGNFFARLHDTGVEGDANIDTIYNPSSLNDFVQAAYYKRYNP